MIGSMASKSQKGKDIAGPSKASKKRIRPTTRVLRVTAFPRGQTYMSGSMSVEEVGKK